MIVTLADSQRERLRTELQRRLDQWASWPSRIRERTRQTHRDAAADQIHRLRNQPDDIDNVLRLELLDVCHSMLDGLTGPLSPGDQKAWQRLERRLNGSVDYPHLTRGT